MAGAEIECDATEALQTLDSLAPADVVHTALEAAGAGMRVAAENHFRDREMEPRDNSGFPAFGQAFPKKYFWAGAHGDSVLERMSAPQITDDTVSININSPALAHKINPNPPPIRPGTGKKYLAIPANARAAGWDGMPRDYRGGGEMAFAYSKTPEGRWMPALVSRTHYQRQLSRGARAGSLVNARAGQQATHGAGEPQFWLVRGVQTRHDPAALPAEEDVAKAAQTAAQTAIGRIVDESN